MAIQLSDRDTLIFNFIKEHKVLLEKHISWFISCDEKPVLIRDRLRKLFYLDYLLCERHGGKLPWWTTPTKPLVYMLSPLTRQMVQAGDSDLDLFDPDIQRHFLEVANLRMIFLQDQMTGLISDLGWITGAKNNINEAGIDATVSFKRNGTAQKVAIINHPLANADELIATINAVGAEDNRQSIWIISRDEDHQRKLQQMLVSSAVSDRLAFTTHQEIYKAGVVKAKWQSSNEQFAAVIPDGLFTGTDIAVALPVA